MTRSSITAIESAAGLATSPKPYINNRTLCSNMFKMSKGQSGNDKNFYLQSLENMPLRTVFLRPGPIPGSLLSFNSLLSLLSLMSRKF